MAYRIAIDAMGGDHAPLVNVQGAISALRVRSDIELILIGDESQLHDLLKAEDTAGIADRLRIVHTAQVIGMDESPVEALKQKRDSSLVRMANMAASGEADAVLSAGNTGACAAISQLKMKPLPGVSRPGIAVVIPSFHGPVVLCDVGANIQAKHHHLYEYAIMGTAFAQRMLNVENPRVGLVSIGEEAAKGTSLVKKTHELLSSDASLDFVGNIEGQDLLVGVCDVAVCDGFVGNIVLKLVEGLAEGFAKTLAREFEQEDESLKPRFDAAIERFWRNHDYSEYGGAPLIGLDGVCYICHGRSDARAIHNAVLKAAEFVDTRLNQLMIERLSAAG
jgi:glycerol-3-phosphate acyltransferase PlsX